MPLILIVKGEKKNATREAFRRGIAVDRVRRTTYGETHMRAPCNRGVEEKVSAWFNAEVPRGARKLNPPGTLLFYSGRCPR